MPLQLSSWLTQIEGVMVATNEVKRCVVTGGAGFIGSTLVDRLLADGWDVLAIDDLSGGKRENLHLAVQSTAFRLEVIDICAPGLLEILMDYRPEVVFHLAAQASVAVSVRDPADDAAVNIVGSLWVLDAARRSGARKIVFAASGGTLYGDVDADQLPADESNERRPQSPYGLSKKTVIDYLELYKTLFDFDFTALALANVYGPRQDPHGEAGVVAIFANDLLNSRQCRIDGDGEQTRDFVFVDDVARAFVLAADRGDGAVLNIGTGNQVSVNQLYALLAEAAGSQAAAAQGPARPSDVRFSALDPRLAADVLGWKPEIELAEGLDRTIRSSARPPTTV
jgi:UDP-glucose 4-epimerase